MRVTGITGAHAAANGDYYLVTDSEVGVWVKDGRLRITGGTDNYSFALDDGSGVSDGGWYLQLGALSPAVVAQTADDPAILTPAAVAAWGSNNVITFVTGGNTISVASVQTDAIAVSPREYLDTNLESAGTAGVKFAVPTLNARHRRSGQRFAHPHTRDPRRGQRLADPLTRLTRCSHLTTLRL
jgi:hypothetical protein